MLNYPETAFPDVYSFVIQLFAIQPIAIQSLIMLSFVIQLFAIQPIAIQSLIMLSFVNQLIVIQ